MPPFLKTDSLHRTCAQCNKDTELRACSECKVRWYCSKQCQKNDWPIHKKSCSDSGITKLILNFCGDKKLSVCLKQCLAKALDLAHGDRLDGLFAVHIDVAIEPVDIQDFAAVFLGRPHREQIPGMLQVNRILAPTAAELQDLQAELREQWRRARERANSKGFTHDAIVLVQLTERVTGKTTTATIHVPSTLLEALQTLPTIPFPNPTTGLVEYVPVTVDGLVLIMNRFIRADHENKKGLRKTMGPRDIQTIRDAATEVHSEPADILRQKMATDPLFKALLARRQVSQGQ
ncbi:hypothetical protein B0H13DRAFT_2102805 [Mycena leptocephala]|nr:hypothetical protein B0H13DRAFT_2102805 [Mycena leptocephala]